MNSEKLQSEIDRRMYIVVAHAKLIVQELEAIDRLKQQGQQKKSSGIGEIVAAQRLARIAKQTGS